MLVEAPVGLTQVTTLLRSLDSGAKFFLALHLLFVPIMVIIFYIIGLYFGICLF